MQSIDGGLRLLEPAVLGTVAVLVRARVHQASLHVLQSVFSERGNNVRLNGGIRYERSIGNYNMWNTEDDELDIQK